MQGLVHGDVKPENLLILPRLGNHNEGGREEGEEASSLATGREETFSAAHPLSFSFALSDFGSARPVGGPPPPGTLDFLPPEAEVAAAVAAAAAALAGESRAALGRSGGGGGSGGSGGGGGSSCRCSPFPSPSSPLFPTFTAAADAASPAADVWAIGATTVDLLTGSPPFVARRGGGGGGGCVSARAATLAAAASEPLRLPRHLSPEARSFCELCLRKVAGERPSARELCGHEWFLRG